MCNCKQTTPCGCEKPKPCEKPVCGCPIKLDSACVIYGGKELIPLGVTAGDRLEGILDKLNNYLGSIAQQEAFGFQGTNLGTGEFIYKGLDTAGVAEFKSIKSTDDCLTVASDAECISLTLEPITSDKIVLSSNVPDDNIGFGEGEPLDEFLRTVDERQALIIRYAVGDDCSIQFQNDNNDVVATIDMTSIVLKCIEDNISDVCALIATNCP